MTLSSWDWRKRFFESQQLIMSISNLWNDDNSKPKLSGTCQQEIRMSSHRGITLRNTHISKIVIFETKLKDVDASEITRDRSQYLVYSWSMRYGGQIYTELANGGRLATTLIFTPDIICIPDRSIIVADGAECRKYLHNVWLDCAIAIVTVDMAVFILATMKSPSETKVFLQILRSALEGDKF